MPIRRLTALALLLLPVFLLTRTPVFAAGEKSAIVEVHLTEYAVQMPKTLPAGPTTFQIRNDGVKTHSFKIEGPGIEQLLAAPVKPNETGTLAVTLQPGEYKIYCPIGNHSAKGMTLSLTVTPKAGS